MLFVTLVPLAGQDNSLYRRAEERQGAGDLAGAAELYREYLDRNPSNAAARSNLGLCYFRLGAAAFQAREYPAAVQSFQRAAGLNPRVPRLYSYYGMSLLFTGDPDGAMAAFRKQLAADANDYPAHYYLAEILASRGRFSEAAPLLRRAVELRPDSAEAQTALEDTLAGRFSRGANIAAGQPAPAVELPGTHLPPRGRAAVLVFGSYTCPNFRKAAPELNRLAAAYGRSVAFLLVYIREAHSGAQWQSTINERDGVSLPPAASIEQKQEYARLCTRKLNLGFPSVVDGMDGAAEKAYAAWPSHVYVIAGDGRIRYASGLGELEFDARALEAAIRGVR